MYCIDDGDGDGDGDNNNHIVSPSTEQMHKQLWTLSV